MPGTRLAWDGGLQFATDGYGGFEPADDTPPASSAPAGAVITAVVVDSKAAVGTRTVPTVRTLSVPRPAYRVVVGGKVVTNLDGARLPLPNYTLISPLLYGSGSISFPTINAAYERAGHNSRAWLKKFATVKVQRDDAGTWVTDYKGLLPDFDHQGRAFTSGPGGEASGRAAMQDRAIPIFPIVRDIGPQVMRTIKHRLHLPTANEPDTGVELLESGGMSQLDFLTEILSKSTQKDGDQWTVTVNSSGKYRLEQKDLTTIDATVYSDGSRCVFDLRRDFTEEPNRIWVQGVDPDGKRIRFAIFPGLLGSSQTYPGSPLSPGDSGDNVTAIAWRLFTVGYLDGDPFGITWTTDADDPLTQAIEDLQDDAGLTVTGTVDAATWRVIFRGDFFSLRGAQIRPAVQKPYTQAFLRDASGNVIGPNPKYDRTKPLVDATLTEMVGFTRRQMQQWAKQELVDDNVSNWVGTITVNTGAVINGQHNPGDALTADLVRDARTIKPGHNLWLPGWDDDTVGGGTLIHVSGVSVSPGSVEFTVDTRARDTMKVWEIINRNRESRKSPSRQWIALNRRSGQRDDTGAFYDGSVFGKIERTFCPANTWTVIATPAGRSGMLQTIDIQTDAATQFALEIWGKRRTGDWLDRKVGDWNTDAFWDHFNSKVDDWQDNHWLIDHWGQKGQACGTGSASQVAPDGTATEVLVSGRFKFKAGAPYYCKGDPVLWIAVRPLIDTHVQGGRVLELLLDDAAG